MISEGLPAENYRRIPQLVLQLEREIKVFKVDR
jgi:hypothetical protein